MISISGSIRTAGSAVSFLDKKCLLKQNVSVSSLLYVNFMFVLKIFCT